MGSSINDLLALGGALRVRLESRGCESFRAPEACDIECRLIVEDEIISVLGRTAGAKNAYRDWAEFVGCVNSREDYDRLLGATGRRR